MREPLVLGYHAITPGWDSPLAVTPDELDRQLRRLLRLGFRPRRFSEALTAPRYEKTFVVTFDDAFASLLRYALPVLDRLGVPASLFVPTGWIGADGPLALWEDMDCWRLPGQESELALMGWDGVRALAAHGWEIGSHTITHPFLTRVDDVTLRDELTQSRLVLEEELGTPCTSLAYPYGDVDARVIDAAAAAGYTAGADLQTMRDYAQRRELDLLCWPRAGIFSPDRRPRFETKLALMSVATRARSQRLRPPSRSAGAAPRIPPVRPGASPARTAVLIPCFNDGALAREAVASVIESEPVEIVVVDDCSTEPETAAALDALEAQGVAVIRKPVNEGLSAARRTGLAATTAPFVFPLDSDDVLLPGALCRLADRLEAEPGAAAAYGDLQEFGTREKRLTMPVSLDAFRLAYRNDYPVCSLFRRTALDEVGAWQDVGGMVGYEDWNLWMSVAERWWTAVHAGPGFTAVRRRLHGQRMLGDAARRHGALYAELRSAHPRLFAELAQHRRRSTLPRLGRLLYPVAYGRRPPLGLKAAWWALLARLKPGR